MGVDDEASLSLVFLGIILLPTAFAEEYLGGDLRDGATYDSPFNMSADAALNAGHTATVDSNIKIGGNKLDIWGTLELTESSSSDRRAWISGGERYPAQNGELYIHNGGVFRYSHGVRDLDLDGPSGAPGRSWFNMTLDDGAAFHTEGVGLNVGRHVALIANGNLYTEGITIQAGGKYKEKSPVTIDGVGGTGTTRNYIISYSSYPYGNKGDITPGGLYEGDVIVDFDRSATEYREEGGLYIAGTQRGNVDLRRGLVEFFNGGVLEGNLTVSDGTVQALEDSPEDRPPTAVYGDIQITGGSFIVKDALPFSATQGISLSGGELNAVEGTLLIPTGQTLSVSGGLAKLSGTDALGADGIAGGISVSGGELAFAGRAALSPDNLTSSSAAPDGVIALSGGTLSAAELVYTDTTNSTLSLAPGATLKGDSVTLAGSGNDVALHSGTVVSGGALTVGDGSGTLTVGGSGTAGSGTAALTLASPGAGTIHGAVTVADQGGMRVEDGTWTASSVSVENGGALFIGSSSAPEGASPGLTVTGGLSSAEAGDGSSRGINILSNGTLSAANDVLFAANNTLQSGLSQIYVDSGAVVAISGVSGALSVEDVAARNAALMSPGSQGLVSYEDADISTTEVPGIPDGVWGNEAEQLGTLLSDKTVVYDAQNAPTADSKGGFGARTLTLINAPSDGMSNIDINGNLTLLGDGQTLATARDSNDASVGIAQLAVAASKTLHLGSTSVAAAQQGGRLDSAVVLNSGASLNAVKGSFSLASVDGAARGEGTVRVSEGGTLSADIGAANAVEKVLLDKASLNAGTLNAVEVSLTNGARADVNSLTLASLPSAGGKLSLGADSDTTGGTTLSAAHVNLNGGMLLIDPAWGLASTNAAVERMGDAPGTTDIVVNGKIGVGMNSLLAVGTRDAAWLPGVIEGAVGALAENGAESALGLYKPLAIAANGAILVDGKQNSSALENTLTGAADTADFASGSLLVVNGADEQIRQGAAAISFENGGAVEVKNGAKLMIADAVSGAEYTIADVINYEGDYASTTGWKGENLLSSSRMLELVSTDGRSFHARRNNASSVFPGLSGGMADAVNTLYDAGLNNTNAPSAGIRFLSRATDSRYLDADAAAESLESAARLSAAGAVPQMALLAADSSAQAVTGRLSLTGHSASRAAYSPGLGLWATPLWKTASGRDLEAGSLDYGFRGHLGGLALGADYTFSSGLRAGLSLNAGGGRAESRGDFSSTVNDMAFWGTSAYLGWSAGDFALFADAGYTATENELKQDLDRRLDMGKLHADIDAEVWHAGLRAEYRLRTSVLEVTPYASVRYTGLRGHEYESRASGTLLRAESSRRDVWSFPVGVSVSGETTTDTGWKVRASADIAAVPSSGDTKTREQARFTGLPGSFRLETRVMDNFTVRGGVGLEAMKDNISLGLNYDFRAGKRTTAHGVMASFTYTF